MPFVFKRQNVLVPLQNGSDDLKLEKRANIHTTLDGFILGVNV